MRKETSLRQVALALLIILAAAGCARLAAQEEKPITPDVVVSVLQEAFPELATGDIQVKMLKRLTSRVKVNLDIKGSNAILYLTWQRRGSGYQWWFEYDPNRSLVYLSKTTRSASQAARKREAVQSSAQQGEQAARTETVEVGLEARKEGSESEAKAEPEQQAETGEATTEVAKAPASESAEAQPDVESTEFEIPPVESAVTQGATSKQFLAALVGVLVRGDEKSYTRFLLRPDEIAEEIESGRIDNLFDIWREQCANVHDSLKDVKKIEISKMVLQRARSEEVESATIERLRRTVPTIREIFTDVKIDLLVDGQAAYIEIGGLMRIDTGWRVGGRMEFVKQASELPPAS
jgi:hypothetical protein